MQNLTFWIVALFLPIMVVTGNGIARWLFGLPHSAASDLILAIVVLDVAVAANAHEFSQFVKWPSFQPHLVAIYSSLIIANLMFWSIAVFKIERELFERYNKQRRRYNKSPVTLVLTSGLMAIFVLLSNTVIFAYGAR
jgi:phosphate/sulfate permease